MHPEESRVIHPTAQVAATARLAGDVAVGPYSVIGAEVQIGAGTQIGAHVVIEGPTRIGCNNRVYPFASLGGDPQDKKYNGGDSRLEIGDANTIREYCTINRGTAQGGGVTRVGNGNWIMAYVHIAHDCVIGDSTVLANNASLAGHVHIQDCVALGGFALVHQFCAVGTHAFVAASALVLKDVPPFVMAAGNPARPRGINVEGLRRRDFDGATMLAVRRAYRVVYRSGYRLAQARAVLEEAAGDPAAAQMAAFIAGSQRGLIR